VIIPARDAAATIGRTLDALAAQDLDEEFEVVVVDDG
jgi:glycosyltransferase involved in cell wall biosynthesis